MSAPTLPRTGSRWTARNGTGVFRVSHFCEIAGETHVYYRPDKGDGELALCSIGAFWITFDAVDKEKARALTDAQRQALELFAKRRVVDRGSYCRTGPVQSFAPASSLNSLEKRGLVEEKHGAFVLTSKGADALHAIGKVPA